MPVTAVALYRVTSAASWPTTSMVYTMKNKSLFNVTLKFKFSGHVQKFFVAARGRHEAYKAALSQASRDNLGIIEKVISVRSSGNY